MQSPLERSLTMAAYTALSKISDCIQTYPDISVSDAVSLIRTTNSDMFSLDYQHGALLYEQIGNSGNWEENPSCIRDAAAHLIRTNRPWWLKLVPSGRESVRSALTVDQVAFLNHGLLFDPVPTADVVSWWDGIAAEVRGMRDADRMIRARKAERLSFEREKQRLLSLGLEVKPEWVALDDNSLGYDIRSYDFVAGALTTKLIEVKSTTADTIFLTRNEWENAKTAGSRYSFHVWKFPQEALEEYSVDDIGIHVPEDKGAGVWQELRIEFEDQV